jgi:ComF family protein
LKKFSHRCGQYLLEIVFPRRCVLCGRVIEVPGALGLCDQCLWQDYQNNQPLDEEGSGRCSLIYEDRLQQALYKMKYSGRRAYGIFFAAWMAEEGKEWAKQLNFDRMTAVPLAKKRMKSRGYNQAEVIARELSRLCRVPYDELLERQRETRVQKGLGEQLRKKNMQGAFVVRSCEEEPKRICVVDDIYTTGSTLRECIRVLQERWPEAEVYYWTLARRNIERI